MACLAGPPAPADELSRCCAATAGPAWGGWLEALALLLLAWAAPLQLLAPGPRPAQPAPPAKGVPPGTERMFRAAAAPHPAGRAALGR